MHAPHPTTGDRRYTAAEVEFLLAMERFRRTNGVKFPTCGQTLAVLESLGYRKVAPAVELPRPKPDGRKR